MLATSLGAFTADGKRASRGSSVSASATAALLPLAVDEADDGMGLSAAAHTGSSSMTMTQMPAMMSASPGGDSRARLFNAAIFGHYRSTIITGSPAHVHYLPSSPTHVDKGQGRRHISLILGTNIQQAAALLSGLHTRKLHVRHRIILMTTDGRGAI